jgi:hypothetical protein
VGFGPDGRAAGFDEVNLTRVLAIGDGASPTVASCDLRGVGGTGIILGTHRFASVVAVHDTLYGGEPTFDARALFVGGGVIGRLVFDDNLLLGSPSAGSIPIARGLDRRRPAPRSLRARLAARAERVVRDRARSCAIVRGASAPESTIGASQSITRR